VRPITRLARATRLGHASGRWRAAGGAAGGRRPRRGDRPRGRYGADL